MPDTFEIGEIAYCEDDDGAWIGEIVGVEGKSVSVKWFADGQRYALPKKQVTPFAKYLKRQSHPRKLKFVYELFYGVRLQRMPQANLRKLHLVLRQHGVDFDQSAVRANHFFRMWINSAHLSRAERAQYIAPVTLPDEITEWLPKWLVADPLPPSSRDPLGLQADAARLADQLLPGLTVFTSRVGYFFFLAWAVREINQLDNLDLTVRRELLNKLERALVLCETLYHGQEFKQCMHLGQRAKSRLLALMTVHVREKILNEAILRNQYTSGCLNLYRTAMASCGFWEEDDNLAAIGKLPFKLTPRGEKLAELFGKRSADEQRPAAQELLKWAHDDSAGRSKENVQGWGRALCFETFNRRKERECFLEGLLYITGDRSDLVAADTRLNTVRVLSRARTLRSGGQGGQTLIGSEIADVDELPESDNPLSNATVLLHFYRHPATEGANAFLDAAIYELLGLGLNAVWKSLLDAVTNQRARLNLADWLKSCIQASRARRLWQAPFERSARFVSLSEEQLVERLWGGESPLEYGVQLLAKVLGNANQRRVLQERLSGTIVYTIISETVLSQGHSTVEEVLQRLLPYLVNHHQQVSERKGKRRWLQLDGAEVYADDAQGMALGFHSYRFPQLFSLLTNRCKINLQTSQVIG